MGLVDSKRTKRLYDAVLAHRKDCDFESIQRLLLALGFSERKTGGSHHTYTLRLPDGRTLRITVPKHRPVKKHYVNALIEMIEGA
ncbi:MAG TPA: type II toxin-antitoxin system HicA family toxin [Candidatus Baltobacteraceae bacterium]|nr:type II toxin-antitoxin system HicA family toxin [Candidatus Baltobacteraceae bacterium]